MSTWPLEQARPKDLSITVAVMLQILAQQQELVHQLTKTATQLISAVSRLTSSPIPSSRPHLPKFAGTGRPNVATWAMIMRVAAEEGQQSPSVEIAKSLLRDRALEWYVHHEQVHGRFRDWESFEHQLILAFGGHHTDYGKRDHLATVRQRGSVNDYILDFLQAVSVLPSMDPRDQLYWFVRGTREELRVELMRHYPSTLIEAYEAARLYESAYRMTDVTTPMKCNYTGRDKKSSRFYIARPAPWRKPLIPWEDPYEELEEGSYQSSSVAKCSRCSQWGHHAWHCD